MNMLFRNCVAASAIAVMVAPVSATPKDYCQAYARDFADMGPKDEKTWTSRHDNALADCLFQYQIGKAEPEKATPRKTVKQASKPAAKPKPVAAVKPEPIAEEQLPEPAVIVAPDIAPPVKPAKQASQPEEPKKKTLLARFFKRKITPEAIEPGKLTPGSAAWLDYCDKKYASFNRDTGTYQSYKGVERKCLVTD